MTFCCFFERLLEASPSLGVLRGVRCLLWLAPEVSGKAGGIGKLGCATFLLNSQFVCMHSTEESQFLTTVQHPIAETIGQLPKACASAFLLPQRPDDLPMCFLSLSRSQGCQVTLFWSISQREISRAFMEGFSSMIKESKSCKEKRNSSLLSSPLLCFLLLNMVEEAGIAATTLGPWGDNVGEKS